MLLVIDNYDSFTYNLVQYLQELGADVIVKRNDKITLKDINRLSPKKIVISPGPGRPEQAGITLELIKKFSATIPILGICLGHQAIGQAFGSQIISAPTIMHGKTSSIYHANQGVFQNLKNPLTATRYHSLIIDNNTLSADFKITAWTETKDIMGIQHQAFPLQGVQFHPESILTEQGHQLLRNFLSVME